ncbi:type I polyketide synthase [Streptomyces ipomoeae]|uniref:type I polyketide synthase n=1 Tax=Streptomyces ipomoeae TaxID=103232 RepID=UPI001146F29A|nr:type I polyketide synthase [Streptomyces ipomoeae]MDX2931241.1 type I polyketide synthase [Streptomyces ipomoeae]TQE16228.1 SDR family NAD(P)-dependent oxidoreductase [Streptomyces ipomoeae]
MPSSGTGPERLDIAIIGLSALLPGAADPDEFWRNVVSGRDLMRDVPPTHWHPDDYHDPDPAVQDKTYARRGAFLDPVDFDPLAFGIPPNQIEATDTTQLLSLLLTRRLLDDISDGDPARLSGDRTGVVIGTGALPLLEQMGGRLGRPAWLHGMREAGIDPDTAERAADLISGRFPTWQEATFPGLLSNVVPGRIANRFDLRGPNYAVDAACASALGALSAAVGELALGRCDLMITGGVDTFNTPLMYVCFSKTPALSRTGDCRPFADSADGTMLGEGLVLFALKRLADAEADGDRVHAVLRGVGSSSDGKGSAVYAPVSEGQARALRRAYEQAGYGPETVELVEGHGTGTLAGDAAEFGGLTQVFGESGRTDPGWCALGSVKSQIGHTKAAAGAAGLLKAVLALRHRTYPPTIKVDRPNPRLPLAGSPFYLNTEPRPWVHAPGTPRRASVSSFGFGGSNFHATVEEYVPEGGPRGLAPRVRTARTELFLCSAPSAAELSDRLRTAAAATDAPAGLAHRSQRDFRSDAPYRLMVTAATGAELRHRLLAAAERVSTTPRQPFHLPDGTRYACTPARNAPTAFLFSGQGSQYVGMGAGLALDCPIAMDTWDSLADWHPEGAEPLHRVVFPPPAHTERERAAQHDRLTATEWAQPALAAQCLAQLAVLAETGVRPDCAAGHSFGELVALHTAGVLTATELLSLARSRGELLRDAATAPGGMTAVLCGHPQARAVLDRHRPPEVWIAHHNAPDQVVVSGTLDGLARAERAFGAAGITVRRLAAAGAFHTPLVATAVPRFREVLAQTRLRAPRLDVYSNARADVYPADTEVIADRLAEHLVSPVRFTEQIDALYARGVRTFVEIGAGGVLTGLAGRILGDREHLAVCLDRPGEDGFTTLQTALGTLAVHGVPVDFGPLWRDVPPPTDFHAGREQKPERINKSMTVQITGANYPPQAPAVPAVPAVPAAVPPAAWTDPMREAQRRLTESAAALQQAVAGCLHALEAATAVQYALQQGQPGAAWTPPSPAPGPWPPPGPSAWMPGPSGWVPGPSAGTPWAPAQAWPPPPVTAPWTPEPAPAQAPAPVPWPPQPAGAAWAQAQATPPAAPPVGSVSSGPATPVAPAAVAAVPPATPETMRPAPVAWSDASAPAAPPVKSVSSGPAIPVAPAAVSATPAVAPETMSPAPQVMKPPPATAGTPSIPAPAPPPLPDTPAAVPAPVPAPEVDTRAVLLGAVAELTGYPMDVLNEEMDMEMDLGIDSIKRVQILAAIRKAIPSLPPLDPGEVIKLRTLGQVREALDQVTGAGQLPSLQGPADGFAPSVSSGLARLVVHVSPAPAPGLTLPGLSGGPVLITDDGGGVAEELAAELRRQGLTADRVRGELPPDARAVVCLEGLRPASEARKAAEAAFRTARAVAPRLASDGGVLVTVQDTGGDFGLGGGSGDRADLGGIAGLARTAACEWPHATVKAIDVERGGRPAAEVARALAVELMHGGAQTDVGLRADGGRVRLGRRPAGLPAAPDAEPAAHPAEHLVVTGGGRGITAACLVELARARRPRLLLLGRTPLADEPAWLRDAAGEAAVKQALLAHGGPAHDRPPLLAEVGARARQVLAAREVRDTVHRLEQAGAQVRYEAVDGRDATGVRAALERARADWGPVTGIVHGAGVLADRPIAQKTDVEFATVYDTKVETLRVLLDAVAQDPLRLLCVFSSVVAHTGNTGQCDYAMANETLHHLVSAVRAARPGLRAMALGWGPWRGGMVDAALSRHFEEAGVPLIDPATGTGAFTAELTAGPGGPARHADRLLLVPDADRIALPAPATPAAGTPETVRERHLADVVVPRSGFPYTEDHVVRGTPVLPLACAVEYLARAAAEPPGPSGGLVLRGLTVLNGVVLDPSGHRPYPLRVRGSRAEDGLRLTLEAVTGRPHYRAVAMDRLPPPAPASAPPPDGTGLPPSGIYDGEVLFHGPRYRMLRAVEALDPGGARAVLDGLEALGWDPRPRWATDPAAVDGLFQLAVLWARRVLGRATLPMGVGEVRLHRAGALGRDLLAVVTPGPVADEQAECDVRLSDPRGVTVAELSGVQLVARPSRK